jgi:hypothetical protein
MAGETRGWSFAVFEDLWNYGFVQEIEHFVGCVREGVAPTEGGDDGRAVVEAVCALCAVAGLGRRVELPFAAEAARPIELWRSNRAEPARVSSSTCGPTARISITSTPGPTPTTTCGGGPTASGRYAFTGRG